jgi:hypothetical protein
VAVEGVPARKADAARREVLVDRRGDITYCVDVAMGGGTATDPLIALAGLRADGGRAEGLNTMSATVFDKPFDRPSPEGALLLGGDITTPPEPDEPDVIRLEAYQLYGLAGAEVTGVDIVLTNGLRITSTVRNGVWGAWWPTDRGDPTGVRLDVRTATGSRSVDPATIRLPWD